VNHWTRAAGIVDAFLREGASIPLEMIVRTLAEIWPGPPGRVLDIGGGDAALAVRLAAVGHEVCVIDIDPAMIAHAQDRLSRVPPEIAARVQLRCAAGDAALDESGAYDLVCCHSVLMYEDDPAPLIAAAVRSCRAGGLISIVAVNPAALAMRPGLAGRWREARVVLETGDQAHGPYAPSRNHSRETIEALLQSAGTTPVEWSGIGVFTDHHTGPIAADDPEELYRAEWLAGRSDPYRQVARCYHLIARAR